MRAAKGGKIVQDVATNALKETAAAAQTETVKKYVTGGPHLWVSTLLHEKGSLSTDRIWEEFLRDKTVSKELINSKSFLKSRILFQMEQQGKIVRSRAVDRPEYKRSGWQVVAAKAFKNTAPSIVMQLDPIPQLKRKDLREYIEKQFQLFEEAKGEHATVEDTVKEAEHKHA